MNPEKVDLHLVATAHLAAGREALRLLGLSWIHTTDEELQQRVFASVIDTVVPFASHSRRLMELANLHLGENERHEFRVGLEVDGEEPRADYPKDMKLALNMVLHSRTLKGVFAKVREKVSEKAKQSDWAKDAKLALVREGHGCLGVPGQNPWRYSPILKVESNSKPKHSIPTISLAMMYFEQIEPRTLKTFGGELSKWRFFDVG